MKVYKIKNLTTGLYSLGGLYPRWGKKGKLWNSKQAIKSHLRLVETEWYDYKRKGYHWRNIKDVYENCIIIEYDFENTITKEFTIDEFGLCKHSKENLGSV